MEDASRIRFIAGFEEAISETLGHCKTVCTFGVVRLTSSGRRVLSEVCGLELLLSTVKVPKLMPEPGSNQ